MRKKFLAAFYAAVIGLLIPPQAFGVGFFEQGQAPAGGYPSSPSFVGPTAHSVGVRDNVYGSGGTPNGYNLGTWNFAGVNIGGLPAVALDNNGQITGVPIPALDNLTDGSYNKTARLLGLILQGGITGVHPSLGTNAVLIGPSGGTIPADMANNGHLIRTNVPGNVLTVQQMDNSSYSAYRIVSDSGVEHSTWGYGNAGAGGFYAGLVWLDAYNPTPGDNTFQVFRIISSMVDNTGAPVTAARMEFSGDGTTYLQYIPVPNAGPAARNPGKIVVGLDNVTIVDGDFIVNDNIVNPIVKQRLIVLGTDGLEALRLKIAGTKTDVNQAAFNIRTNEESNYMSVNFSIAGAANIADRAFKIQVSEVGVGNNGVISLQPAGGRVGIGTASPVSKLAVVGLVNYANNAAAAAGGMVAGDFYRTGADPDLVCVVH